MFRSSWIQVFKGCYQMPSTLSHGFVLALFSVKYSFYGSKMAMSSPEYKPSLEISETPVEELFLNTSNRSLGIGPLNLQGSSIHLCTIKEGLRMNMLVGQG